MAPGFNPKGLVVWKVSLGFPASVRVRLKSQAWLLFLPFVIKKGWAQISTLVHILSVNIGVWP